MSRAIDKLGFYQEPPAERGETVLAAEFASDMALKQDWMGRILEAIRGRWTILPPEAKRIEPCLDEAIQNAIVWGTGKDPAKKVRFRLWSEDGRWGLTVHDEGLGFTKDAIPDYDSEEFLWQDHGRGIRILLHYLSEVAYYDSGRTLVLKA